jgi:ferritin-like metal-binding protein YciE
MVGSTWKDADKTVWCTCGRCGQSMPKHKLEQHIDEVHFGIKTVEQGAVADGNDGNGVTPLMVKMIVDGTLVGAFAPDEIVAAAAVVRSRTPMTSLEIATGGKAHKPRYNRPAPHQRGMRR